MKSTVEILSFIRSLYPGKEIITLHEPALDERDERAVAECVRSGYVSSVGEKINAFERKVCDYTGSAFAVATVNGTQALFMALKLAGVSPGDEVITQSLTFVATANAITYCGAAPVFIDADEETLGLDPEVLQDFIGKKYRPSAAGPINRETGARLAAVVPMHTFGHIGRLPEISEICNHTGIPLVEDAAEALGSFQNGRHAGRSGYGILSFNGNKIITTGGGGMILTDSEEIQRKAKHLTTTAKKPHPYEFDHDEIGYNFRMPNLNAALGLSQMEKLPSLVEQHRGLHEKYADFFSSRPEKFLHEPDGCRSNYWLQAVRFSDREARMRFLQDAVAEKIHCRPLWKPMHSLPMFSRCLRSEMKVTEHLHDTLVNLPSSPPSSAA